MADDIRNIVQDCLAGQRQAQERLYKLLSPKMFALCLRYCKDYDEARDVLQEGFVKVFTKLEQFHFEGSFEGWVRRIMVNTAIEKLKFMKRSVSIEVIPEKAEDLEESELPPISQKEMLQMIQELPAQYKLVFNMYVFEELSHREIGEMLGISEGGSKSNLSRARAILQEKIKLKIRESVRIFGT